MLDIDKQKELANKKLNEAVDALDNDVEKARELYEEFVELSSKIPFKDRLTDTIKLLESLKGDELENSREVISVLYKELEKHK